MTEQAYIVTSTFCQAKVLRASSHRNALSAYIDDLEASGRSYPEEAAVYVLRRDNDERKLFVVVDGFFEEEPV